MRILGIDPGMAILGWSLLDSDSSELRYGCVETSSELPLAARLTEIYKDRNGLVDEGKPDVIAVETLFFVKNAKTLAQVGHTRGVILLVAGLSNIQVYEY